MTNYPAGTVLMIAPVRFAFNQESANSNSFQNKDLNRSSEAIQREARAEFDELVTKLRAHGVEIIQIEDTTEPETPDSIFPNNWFSTHQSGKLVTYPMMAENRRKERRQDIIDELLSSYTYSHLDLSFHEQKNDAAFLEGTGSMVIDHENNIIYAARSVRTDESILTSLAEKLGMEIVIFDAFGKNGEPIYHTNVMLCIGSGFAVIGSDTISEYDRQRVLSSLDSSGKDIIELNNEQVYEHFAGNMLQLKNSSNEKILVMSQKAHDSLTEDQLQRMKYHNEVIISSPVPTIESIGGGSVRCMIAEIFTP